VCNGCDECGLRCTEGVPMTLQEYRAITEYLAATEEPTVTADPAAPADLGDGVFITPCRFRDTKAGLCRVYPVRPLVCRLMGHVEWMPCPVSRVPRPAPTALTLAALEEYCAQRRQPYEAWLAETE